MKIAVFLLSLSFTTGFAVSQSGSARPPDHQWPTYGGDAGGSRYSTSAQVNKANVGQLRVAWTFHTGAPQQGGSLEVTPILFKGSLYLSSPTDYVFSIDPATGQQRWSFNPQIDTFGRLGIITSRGIAAWSALPGDARISPTRCADRIFIATMDARLIALDAASGERCTDFGSRGAVDLTQNVDFRPGDDYAVTSPPTVVGDVVVVGSGIEDNLRVDVELGDVRGFDARSGKLLWTWEPMPWAKQQRLRTGAGNTWGVIAADLEHGLIYLPTSSPSPDYYGGLRPGDDRDADSIVALNARTGQKVWSFQIVHHDLWDYDLAAEPLLFTFRGKTPAVAVTTKMGLVFVFDRFTGKPLYPIHERPVPRSDVPGEVSAPTQPFPDLPPLSPITFDTAGQLGVTPDDDTACRAMLKGLRYDGIYTPPSLHGTLLFPSNVGGVNWGSAAFDPVSGTLYANTNRIPVIVTLRRRPFFSSDRPFLALTKKEGRIVRRSAAAVLILLIVAGVFYRGIRLRWYGVAALLILLACLATSDRVNGLLRRNRWVTKDLLVDDHFGKEYGQNIGTPYVLFREPMIFGDHPCGPTPWGTVSALNLNTGKTAWQTPLGTAVSGLHTGTWSVGGPIVTMGGLVFTAASEEPFLRAFDSATGEELWKGALPVPAQATPMTYTLEGKQYVVIAAGGHPAFGSRTSDSIVAFSLP